jgi:two-component system LytT family response regulator
MENNNSRPIRIPVKKGQIITDAGKILYCEADGNCTKIFCTDNNVYVVILCLKQVEQLLEGCNFYRCHKSYLVNCDKVNGFFSKNNVRYVRITDKLTVPVSRDFYTDFKNYMMKLVPG